MGWITLRRFLGKKIPALGGDYSGHGFTLLSPHPLPILFLLGRIGVDNQMLTGVVRDLAINLVANLPLRDALAIVELAVVSVRGQKLKHLVKLGRP